MKYHHFWPQRRLISTMAAAGASWPCLCTLGQNRVGTRFRLWKTTSTGDGEHHFRGSRGGKAGSSVFREGSRGCVHFGQPPNQRLKLAGALVLKEAIVSCPDGHRTSSITRCADGALARSLRRAVGRTIREDGDVRKSAHQTCPPFCLEISLECPTLR